MSLPSDITMMPYQRTAGAVRWAWSWGLVLVGVQALGDLAPPCRAEGVEALVDVLLVVRLLGNVEPVADDLLIQVIGSAEELVDHVVVSVLLTEHAVTEVLDIQDAEVDDSVPAGTLLVQQLGTTGSTPVDLLHVHCLSLSLSTPCDAVTSGGPRRARPPLAGHMISLPTESSQHATPVPKSWTSGVRGHPR